MRATFQDTDMARLTGVDVDRVYMFHVRLRGGAGGGVGGAARRGVLGLPGDGGPRRAQVLRRGHHGRPRQLPRRHRRRPAARRVREPRRGLRVLGLQGRHRLRPDHHPAPVAPAGALRQRRACRDEPRAWAGAGIGGLFLLAAAPRRRRLLSAPADHGRALLPPRRRHEPLARRGPAQPGPHGLLRHRRRMPRASCAALRAHAASDHAAGRRVHRAWSASRWAGSP